MRVKTAFSENPIPGYQMSLSDFALAAKFYSEKHGISLVWNGAGLPRYRDGIERRMNALRDPEEKYAAFLSVHYSRSANHTLSSLEKTRLSDALSITGEFKPFVTYFAKKNLYDRLLNIIGEYLDDRGHFRDDLSDDEKLRLNLKMNAPENAAIKTEMDALIQVEIELFPLAGTPMSHSDNDYLNEMTALSEGLSENQYLGYLFTDSAYTLAHYEVFVVGPRREIIRPVAWPIADNVEMQNALLRRADYFQPPHFL